MPDVRAKVGYIHPNLVDRTLSKEESQRLMNPKYRNVEGLVWPEMMFYDVREMPAHQKPTLAANGMTLVPFVSAVKDYRDLKEVREVIYPEAEALVKKHTGAAHVWTFHHTVRDARPKNKASGASMLPLNNKMESNDTANFAHTDATLDGSTEAWARRRLKGELKLPEEQTTPENMDVAVIGVWKPFDREVSQDPLAMLDFETYRPGDAVLSKPSTVGIGGATPGTLTASAKGTQPQLQANPNHRWLWWSRMQPDEALLFNQMNTCPGQGVTYHTSFEDPTAPADAPGRRSIEIRVLAGFPKQKKQAAL